MTETNQSKKKVDKAALSVHYLKTHFLPKVERTPGLSRTSTFRQVEDLGSDTPGIIRLKGLRVTCPIDRKTGAAYVHCVKGKDNVGEATHMLSWTWGYTVGDVVDTLVDYCASEGKDPKRTYVWMCCFCINQHRVVAQKKLERSGILAPEVDFFAEFGERVSGIGHLLAMMAPWNNPGYITRVWCVYELFIASTKEGCKITCVMPPREKSALEADLIGKQGKGVDLLYSVLAKTRVQDAEAGVAADKEKILGMIRKGPGYERLNQRVNRLLRICVRRTVFEAIGARERVNEKRRPTYSYAKFCHKVSVLLARNNDLVAASAMAGRAVRIHQEIGSQDCDERKEFALCLNTYGRALCSRGDFHGAQKKLHMALSLQEHSIGLDHPDVALTLDNLGCVDSSQGLFDSAQKNHEKALGIWEQGASKKKTTMLAVAGCCYNLGFALCRLERYDEALPYHQRALDSRQRLLGDHPDTAMSHREVGFVLQKQAAVVGRESSEEAMQHYRRALSIIARILGSDDQEAVHLHDMMAALLPREEADVGSARLLLRHPLPRDVVFGRGGFAQHHVGNEHFRELMRSKQVDYLLLRSYEEKRQFVEELVRLLSEDLGARFLEYDRSQEGWVIVSEPQRVKEKVRTALCDSKLKAALRIGPTVHWPSDNTKEKSDKEGRASVEHNHKKLEEDLAREFSLFEEPDSDLFDTSSWMDIAGESSGTEGKVVLTGISEEPVATESDSDQGVSDVLPHPRPAEQEPCSIGRAPKRPKLFVNPQKMDEPALFPYWGGADCERYLLANPLF